MGVRQFFSLTFHAILFLKLSVMDSALAATLGNETDKLALLDFKSQLTDNTVGVLASWNNTLHFCQWIGVSCSRKHQRVTGLNLQGQKLAGSLSPHIGNFSFLQFLNLSENYFHGSIPAEIGCLFRLQHLNLSYNSFGGEIPANLSKCSNLMNLDLGHNFLVHQIPSDLRSLSKLVVLFLDNSNLTGRFPASFGNLSSLQQLSFAYNHLEGEIPDTIALMTSIKHFEIEINNLSGVFPPILYNLSSLELIALTYNHFYGNLRPDLGITLPNLQILWLGGNDFTGTIPDSLSNASNIIEIDIPENSFTGNVPSFGSLHNLTWLGFWDNSLGSNATDDLSFLLPLTNCSRLQTLYFDHNNFGGELPISITNLSIQLTSLNLSGNYIGGSIPTGIANLNNLNTLDMSSNLLTGILPPLIGRLSNLRFLSLGANKLTGEIPSSIGNITRLLHLYLYDNSLEGNIPSSLGNCKYLQTLYLYCNKLDGSIPIQLISASSLLIQLNVSHNSLSGPLPQEVGNLKNIVYLGVSYNRFSGEIPSTLGNCLGLEQLYIQANYFEGIIPDLRGLNGIQILDLSHNNLSGQIPKYMVKFPSLQNLNLSFNNLEGEVPVLGVFQNASAIEVYGNSKLCGGIQELQLHPCPIQSKNQRKHRTFLLILVIVIVALSVLLLFFISLYWLRKLKKKELSTSAFGHFYPKVSYEELRNATAGFSLSNLIGSGHFGSVYRGILAPGEKTVAVKVLKLQQHGASKSFMAECCALRNIRHRNLVKVLTVCSSIDFEGNEFKALVYEFMLNGSLEMWLHPEGHMRLRNLSFLQRINIAIDVASALVYLHQHCHTVVIHCDLKPSNVLLDDDLIAHVSDFGMARLLSKSGKEDLLNQFSSAGIKGTIGYAAPEYGMGGELSTKGDVYSFGILLLEMFTEKRPTNESFIGDLNLHNFVKFALPGRVMDVVDQSVLYDEEVGEIQSMVYYFEREDKKIECLISIFQIAISCSTESPRDRMDMEEAILELISIRDRFL